MRRRRFLTLGALAALSPTAPLRRSWAQESAADSKSIEIPGFGRVSLDPADYDAAKIAGWFQKDFPRGVAMVRSHYADAVQTLSSGDAKKMTEMALPLVRGAARANAAPFLGQGLRDSLMTAGEPETVAAGHRGEVFYVNGIFTSRDVARQETRTLAAQLPDWSVSLFYNEGTAPSDDPKLAGRDVEEAFRDRVWPVTLSSILTGEALGAGLRSALAGDSPLQHNPTTRHLAHLLYQRATTAPDKPVAVVGYSQGAMIVRNALFTLAMLDQQSFVEQRVAFVAPGLPLNNHEVWPVPKKFTPLVDPQDPVPAYLGLQGDGLKPAEASVDHHGWFENGYASRINPAMLTL